MSLAIPFNRPPVMGGEADAIAAAIAVGHLSGDGARTKACHMQLEQVTGAAKAMLTTSCTHALEMTALLLDLVPGDEIIVPSFTFVSSVNAYVLRGARPVFADVRPDTLNLDESRLEALITPRTKAIVVVHYAGVACAMDEILAIAARHGVAVIEDNAHGLFGTYKGRPLGSLGVLAALSFHETKNITCGEGGALLLNDRGLIERAEILREKGTNRSRFFRGQVDKYTWVDLGSSYLPSELLAAYLEVQLGAADRIQARRRVLWERYDVALGVWAAEQRVVRPTIPAECGQAYHMYWMLLPSLADRTAFIAALKAAGMGAVFHYLPLHRSPMAEQLGASGAVCPVTDDISDRLVRLPFHFALSDDEQGRVLDVIRAFTAGGR